MMGKVQKGANWVYNNLMGTRAAGVYMLVFAASIGIATFIENDFGTSAAQKVVFRALWFEILLILFGTTIIANVYRYRMFQRRKWSLVTFHLAIIIILIGAGITRYAGFEGVMHIRENDKSNTILSAETYLLLNIDRGEKTYRVAEPVLFASLGNNNWSQSYLLGSDEITVEVNEFIPNPIQEVEEDPEGKPTLKVVVGGASGREEYYVKSGDQKRIRGVAYNFTQTYFPAAVNIWYRNDSLLIRTSVPYTYTVMATQQQDTLWPSERYDMLRLRALYSDGTNSFVFGDFHPSGKVVMKSENVKVKNESLTALDITVSVNGEKQQGLVYGKKGLQGRPVPFAFNDQVVSVSYGAKQIELPFEVYLYDFILEKYPGTNSAASYASEVRLVDPRNQYELDYRIYMNHILDYGGYRFFQSSFDQDEQGTYLSVNHDFWGTWVSYLGYFLFTLGLIMVLFTKDSRFAHVSRQLKKMRAAQYLLPIILIASFHVCGFSQVIDISPDQTVSASHAQKFSEIVVQDHKGRMKPMHTLSREIMRKVNRKESMFGLNADQIILGMVANSKDWQHVPFIKLGKHADIKKLLGVATDRAAYQDFFDKTGAYVLREEVRRAYGLQPIDRGTFEKELLKIDERLNIVSMTFSGRLLRIIPVPDHENNTWVSHQMSGHDNERLEQPVAKKFFAAYPPALKEAMTTGDYTLVDQIIEELDAYQRRVGHEVRPSDRKIHAEIWLNNLNVFNRLAVVYMLLGLAFLALLFTSVFKPGVNLSIAFKILFGFVILAFVFHTVGLGLRWYVSGRAPWSNGYETMIYIAWTSGLAGLIFTRKSYGGLAATMILSGTLLLVAALSYLDPEITPLVPVLKSYWLTIHVSLEAGSYGFLMLGALIGLINLILMIFLTERNKERLKRIGKEMTYISEMTLTGGLIMVSVGTYLGGIWANESWGRYWGWDAKETWALVTILVYAFILHMRMIPGLRGIYAFNLASLFGWASVIMTYYGVNYYLSGLHSYAAGDPVPIPNWVYIAVASCIVISILAYWRKRKYKVF